MTTTNADKQDKVHIKSLNSSQYRKHVRLMAKVHRPKQYGRFRNFASYLQWYKEDIKSQRGKRVGFARMSRSMRKRIGLLGARAKLGHYKGKSQTAVYMKASRQGIIGPRFKHRERVRKAVRKNH